MREDKAPGLFAGLVIIFIALVFAFYAGYTMGHERGYNKGKAAYLLQKDTLRP